MKNIKNFSLQKCASNNNIFKKEETNKEFEKYIKQIMNHKILRKTFKQIKNSKEKTIH